MGFRCGPHHWLSLRVCVGPFGSGGAVSSFSPPARRGVGYCWASYWCCFCASSCGACGFPRRVLPQVTLRGLRNLSGSSCLSCSCGGAMYVGFAVSLVRRLVFYLVLCSSSGACGLRRVALGCFCLIWHRLPWLRRLGSNPSLMLSLLLLHRLACRGSLGSAPCVRELPYGLWLLFGWQCSGAFWLYLPLGLCLSFCRLLLRFSTSVGAVLCSLLAFPCLRVGALLA